MSIPSTITQVLATLVLVVPGFVFQAVRIRLNGRTPADIELAGRVLRAIVISTVFALAYFIVLGDALTQAATSSGTVFDHPRRAAAFGLLGGIVIPAAVAVFPSVRKALRSVGDVGGVRDRCRALLKVNTWTQYDTRPTAWDVAFAQAEVGWFVRIKMANGTWFAGYWGEGAWASTFPDPPSLFVDIEYEVGETGVIGAEVTGSRGSVIDCRDAVLVELLKP